MTDSLSAASGSRFRISGHETVRCVGPSGSVLSRLREDLRMKPMYLAGVENHDAGEPHATLFSQMRGAGIPIPQILHLFASRFLGVLHKPRQVVSRILVTCDVVLEVNRIQQHKPY